MRIAIAGLCLAATAAAQDTARAPRGPVTPEDERTSFVDARAKQLLERARTARFRQDSALRAYDAKAFLRISVGMGFRRIGPQRLLFRSEHAARVQWQRGTGLWVEPTGRRSAFPMGSANLDLAPATPIPYFPARETLWMPSNQGVVQVDVDEQDLIHPLANGAEAYYRYRTGDSVSIRLPDGRSIALRELRISARRPEWRSIVGSFWFDVASGGLVRAAYRMSAEIDLWDEASEEQKRDIAYLEKRLLRDTGEVAEKTRKRLENIQNDRGEIWIARTFLSPARAKLSAVTVEYGLYEGRFWLPQLNVAEGEFLAGFVRVPLKWEESFRYASVNAPMSLPVMPAPGAAGVAADDTSWASGGSVNIGVGSGRRRIAARLDTSAAAVRAREDSAIGRWIRLADTARVRADSAKALGDTARARENNRLESWYRSRARQIVRRRDTCAGNADSSFYSGIVTRYDGALRMAIRMPCDTSKLANSPDLPGSIYEPGEQLFGTQERDALLDQLGFGLQAGWGPQKPVLHIGIDLLRFNRIEALSVGASLTSQLGLGYTARLLGRFGTGDLVPNGELSLSRSNGRSDVRLAAFHRLAVANDDFGAPLSFGASLANVIDAGDEGYYHRTFGLELAGTRDAPGPLGGALMSWRLFAERQRSAGTTPNTQVSLGNLVGNARFGANIDAPQLSAFGAAADVARSFGANPSGFRLDTRMRLEGAGMIAPASLVLPEPYYGRGVLDATLSHPVTRRFSAAVTLAGGSSVGTLPIQRAFFVGGLNTVRGQSPSLSTEGHVGDAFWLGRAELGFRNPAFRPSVFYDMGWAGPRSFETTMRQQKGWGVGVSVFDGLLRFDASRGLWPEKQWRFDAYIGARF